MTVYPQVYSQCLGKKETDKDLLCWMYSGVMTNFLGDSTGDGEKVIFGLVAAADVAVASSPVSFTPGLASGAFCGNIHSGELR